MNGKKKMNSRLKYLKFKNIYEVPSLWMINDELGICYPGKDDSTFCINYDNKKKKWVLNLWNAEYLFNYSEHPDVDFLGYIE